VVDPVDRDRQTPLHYAAHCGHISCVDVLLSFGADGRAKNKESSTPLALAAQAGHEECVKVSLQLIFFV
jgi:ankyrin repeat protein